MTKTKKTDRPVSCWVEKERLGGEVVDCLTVILRTRGCRWRRCLMCGFSSEFARAGFEELKKQIDFALSKFGAKEVLKIFTSGSFFDDWEVPPKFRSYVYGIVEKNGIEKLIVESRPEFVFNFDCPGFEVEVGIGLETSNDFFRENCINKGFTFEEYVKAAKHLKKLKARVRTYLLLKPPFLSEGEAIEDCLNSIRDCSEYSDTVSINPVYVPSNTYLERLWSLKLYRPPWLWSAVEVLKKGKRVVKNDIICDPVGAGSKRAAHNCGKCDREFAMAIKEFSLTQDLRLLELECECFKDWKKCIDYEGVARFALL